MGRIGTIINRKGKQDAKRAKIFTKLGRSIMVAAREGGSDPEYNAALAMAVEKARAENMPKDNIDRAIKKGAGELEGSDFIELSYEGYGPGGSAVIVECLTDNLNRTASQVRSYFTKVNGSLAKNGSVTFMFDRLGVLVIDRDENIDLEALELDLLEAGADDYSPEDSHIEIYTEVQDFAEVRDKLKAKGYSFSMAELRYLPQNVISLNDDEHIKGAEKLLDLLEEDDDVQNIFYNFEH